MICFIYSLILMMFSLIFFVLSLYMFVLSKTVIIEFPFYDCNSIMFIMTFLFDWVSLLFMSIVMLISSSVIFYSFEYMQNDFNLNRFIMLVLLFVLSMSFLIISPNLMSILLGWDGLGLISYCLVIYYQNEKSYNAGMLTLLTNRLGDVALLMAIVWMVNYGSWSFINYLGFLNQDFIMILISFFVILASITKSAQIPFSSWLPAAMVAPTPVSSLVHSSTLVTAGVYLLIRFSPMFGGIFMSMMIMISVLTMFMAGLGANFEYDLKKIIALSTLSQLGLMLTILFLGDIYLAYFHLIIHALFKALLFMCAGFFIHVFLNCQDIRYMGNMNLMFPIVTTYFNICSMSLCGLPFLSGFYSKDLIAEFISMSYFNGFIYLLFFVSVGFTVSYSYRLYKYSMGGSFYFFSLGNLSENWGFMIFGMSFMVLFVVFSGSMFMWLFLKPYYICLTFFFKLMTLLFILLGFYVGSIIFNVEFWFSSKILYSVNLSYFFGSMWNMPNLSTLGLIKYPNNLGMFLVGALDLGWFEYYGSMGLFKLLYKMVQFIQLLSLNYYKSFIIMLLCFVIFQVIF
uniref:NADH-ubiquinone oxidoreductase chain 5 n=1 Tax=Imatidium capense TaxID=294609 RepID=U3KZY6_9CUCU|nr:NADH dehydrogenase subunit 5 [Imatidium capense]